MHTSLSAAHSSRAGRIRAIRALFATLVVSMLAACGGDLGEAKLKTIPKGAKRDAVLSTMGTGPLTATRENDALRIVNGFRRQIFISQARQIEVLWYREAPGTLNDRITKDMETPVVVEADSLVGWGWKFYTPFAATMKLPDPARDSIRLDSMAKASLPPNAK